MDDFRVGSIASPDPYGNRRTIDTDKRRRQQHHDEPGQEGEPGDRFEAAEAEDPQPEPSAETIEDYYEPSPPPEETE